MACTEFLQSLVGNQLAGGIVGVAEKNGVDSGECPAQLFQIRQKTMAGPAEKKFRFNPVYPATVGVVGVGGAKDKDPLCVEGRAGGIDELGRAASGQYPFSYNFV